MRIVLVGFGKMGQMIRESALAKGHEVSRIIDPVSPSPFVTDRDINPSALEDGDVVIDFTTPSVILGHLDSYISLGLKSVIGTTGWYDSLPQVKGKMASSSASMIYSGNYSLGVAAFLLIAKRAGQLLERIGGYDEGILEIHHKEKADSPSGTALMLASALGATEVECETLHRKKKEGEVQIASLRCGHVPGTHTVLFDGEADSIELTHRARSRQGFASGALMAASWIVGQKSGLYVLDDMLANLFATQE